MNLNQLTELEDLREELDEIQAEVSGMYKQNISPVLDAKCKEFILAFEEYFKAKNFEVSKNGNLTKVKYKSLEFTLERSNNALSIKQGLTELAHVYIEHSKYNGGGSYTVPPDKYKAEKESIQREIDRAEKNKEAYQNPSFAFFHSYKRKSYETPYKLLEDMFE